MKAPVYVVKPKNVFKHPFNKFDLDKPTTRETQNEDLTDYFNYGFNEDTMNIYGKLVKRTIETLDESINPEYFDAPSMLMRLNDQIPMDFGGFCKFFDQSVFCGKEDDEEGLQNMENFHNGEELFEYLICLVIMAAKPEYPLIDFVHNLYRTQENESASELCDIVDQIQKNLERKYQEMMVRLVEKKNTPVAAPAKNNDYRKNEKPSRSEQKKEEEISSSSDDSSSSESDDSESSEHHSHRRKDKKRGSKSRGKEREKSRERKSSKKKYIKKEEKKKGKEKDRRRRSYSRDRHKKSKSERKEKHDKHKKHRR